MSPGPGPRQQDRRAASMAHRKGLVSGRVASLLAVVLVLAVLLAGRVLILNQMTVLRANIAVLEDRKGFLETRSASLLEKWNRETSAQVVCRRAASELGLVRDAQPGLVLVRHEASTTGNSWHLPAWLQNLAGGDPVQAAGTAPIRVTGTMVSLEPRSDFSSSVAGGGR